MSIKGANARVLAIILLAAAAGGGFLVARIFDPHGSEAEYADEHGEHEEGEHAEGEHADEQKNFVSLKPQDAAAAGVEIVSIERGSGVDLILPGRVAVIANAQSTVGSPLDGMIVNVHVATGSKVQRGTPVATIRSPEGGAIRAEVDAARASLEAAEALDARSKGLLEQGAISQQLWESTRADTLTAQANLRAAEAKAAAMGSPDANGLAVIRSPIAGVVTRVTAAPGAVLDDGMEIATVSDASKTELVFDAPPATLGQIEIGASIEAHWTSGQKISAQVTGVAPASAGGFATVRARALSPAPPPGTVISGRLANDTGSVLTVPSEAVQTLDGVSSVFIAEPEGFHATPVMTGRISSGRTEIVSGLEGNEQIAGAGAFLLKAELGKGEAEHDH